MTKDGLRALGVREAPAHADAAYRLGGELGLLRVLPHVEPGEYVCPGDACDDGPFESTTPCALCEGLRLLVVDRDPEEPHGHGLDWRAAEERLAEMDSAGETHRRSTKTTDARTSR